MPVRHKDKTLDMVQSIRLSTIQLDHSKRLNAARPGTGPVNSGYLYNPASGRPAHVNRDSTKAVLQILYAKFCMNVQQPFGVMPCWSHVSTCFMHHSDRCWHAVDPFRTVNNMLLIGPPCLHSSKCTHSKYVLDVRKEPSSSSTSQCGTMTQQTSVV